MSNFSKNIIKSNYTIRQSLAALNNLGKKANMTMFVVNEKQQLIATLTDGDIRRALVKGKSLENSIDSVMNKNFKFLTSNDFAPQVIKEFREKNIELIPYLDKMNRIIRIFNLNEMKSLLPIDAVIMAGGMGRRLLPLTEKTPKPLLKVGDKPILEYGLDLLKQFGITNIYITVNYLKDQIKSRYGNGKAQSINIEYIEETQPLGTIGAVSQIRNFKNEYVLVMNSDLLTNIDLEDLFLTFLEAEADMAVAVIPYKVKVPYAIMEVNENQVKSFKEKPTFTYYSNAGIYLVKKKLLNLIPKKEKFDSTDLMEKVVSKKLKLISYRILGYWLDIGKIEDYEKAQLDIKHLNL